jgi:hypothetical protein
LAEAVDSFLSTVATVKRVDLTAAVEQFVESRKLRTVAKDGKRPQLSPGWHYNVAMWLGKFAGTFPSHAVTDLTREHLNAYLNEHGDVSPRTRNCRRNSVRMFLEWAVMELENDRFAWQGSQIALLCFDEVQEFEESQFWFLFSRNRSMSGVKCRIRATCNPVSDGWLRSLLDWWIDPGTGLAIQKRSGVLRWFIRDGDAIVWADTKGELLERFGGEWPCP